LGTNGYEIERFECRDKRMSLKNGLQIGKKLSEFELQFGSFKTKSQSTYSKTFNFNEKKIELILEIKGEEVTNIVITSTNEIQ
jgi:hypothetical protein